MKVLIERLRTLAEARDPFAGLTPEIDDTWGRKVPSFSTSEIFGNPTKRNIYGFTKKSDLKKFVLADVDVRRLIPTQHYVRKEGVEYYMKKPHKEPPMVILDGGKLYLVDHTRTAAQVLKGAKRVKARVFKFEQTGRGKGEYSKPDPGEIP
jgi:hypothetical protein